MDLVSNMPMTGAQYNYTDATAVNALNETSWLLPDTYGGTCSGWDADAMSSGFSGGWGCPADWCSDKWCYVDPCECSDYAIGETFMFSGVSLYFSYGLCCGGFSTAATCGGLGAGECTWNTATSTCDQDSPAAYISNRCISKGTDETTCNAFSSCYWVSGACAAKSIADRLGALSCPTTAPTDVGSSSSNNDAWWIAMLCVLVIVIMGVSIGAFIWKVASANNADKIQESTVKT